MSRIAVQVEVAQQIALHGSPAPGRRLCGALFLDHLPLLTRDPAVLQAYVACLLLLEMSALLPRLLQAVFGVELDMVRRGGPAARRWSLSLGNGVTMLVPALGPWLEPTARAAQSASWSRRILEAAAEEGGAVSGFAESRALALRARSAAAV